MLMMIEVDVTNKPDDTDSDADAMIVTDPEDSDDDSETVIIAEDNKPFKKLVKVHKDDENLLLY